MRSISRALIEGGVTPISATIAFTYNLKRPVRARPGESSWRAGEADAVPFDFYSEFDSPATIEAIAGALRADGHEVHLVEATEDLPAWLLTHPVDVAFNIAEGTHGPHRESQVPAILESLGIPFTGSSSLTLALALDKAKTKQVLMYEGLHTPPWQLFAAVDEPLNPTLRFPLIVKPNREGSAKGVSRESVVWDEASLRRQVQRIYAQYHQEVLVEEFIEGTEVTVGVLGNDEPQVLPILEIDFSSCERSGEFFYSWRMKEYQGDVELGLDPVFHCPARLDPERTVRVQAAALRAHRALGCFELSRTDIRLRPDGTPFILEVNPLPGLDPRESNFPLMTAAAGIAYPVLIHHLLELALARHRQARASRPSTLTVAQTGWDNRPVAQTQAPSPSPAPWRGQLVESRTAP